MTSPGGAVVGRASIRVLPDTSGFREKLEADLAKMDPDLKVDVTPELDTAKLRAQLAALDAKDIQMRVDIDGLTEAFVDLTELEAVVNRLDGRTINIRIDVDGLTEAIAQLAALRASLGDLNDDLDRIRNLRDNDGTLSQGGSFALGTLLRIIRGVAIVGAVSTLLVYAGAALTAAWGIVSTAIAGVPAALTLIAVPAAAVALGIDGITKAAKTLQPELDRLRKKVSDTFEVGFTKAFNMIRPIFGSILTPGFVSIAKTINDIALAIARLLGSTDGFTLLTNIFTGVNTSLRNITPGILDIIDATLILAGRKSLFDALVNSINAFGNAWRTQLVDNIQSGALDAAFRNLGALLVSLSEGLAAFIHNGIEVFATAGPEITRFFDSLTGFFNKFDWERLGVAVGNVFKGLSDALDRVDPATIERITRAFEDMGKAFSDPKFVDNLTKIIENLPQLLSIMTQIGAGFVTVVRVLTDVLVFMDDFGAGLNRSIDDIIAAFKRLIDFLPSINFPIVGAGLFGGGGDGGGGGGLGGFFSGLLNSFTTNQPAIEKAAGELVHNVPSIVGQGLSLVPTEAEKQLGAIPKTVQSTLGPVPDQARQIFLQVQPAIQGAFAGLVTTAQLGFASVAAAVATGGPGLIAALTTAFVGTDVVVTTAFQNMAVKATEGLTLVANAITTGFQTIIFSAFDVAFVGVGDKFVELGVQMAAKMTEGLELVRTSAITKILEIDDVFLKAQQVWVSLIQVGLGLMTTYMQTGFDQMLAAVQVGLNQITTEFFIWSFTVNQLVIEAMVLFTSSMRDGIALAAQAVDEGLGRMVAALQTAVGQFREAGSNMGAALAEGLRSRQGEVEAAAAALANAAAAAVRAAAVIRSPSKVFDHLGQMVGKGFAGGMWRTIGLIKTVSVGMVQAVNGSFSKLIDSSSAIGDLIGDVVPKIDTRTSVYATGASLNVDDRSFGDIKQSVHDALATWSVEIDQQGIAKLVNKANLRNARR